MSATTTETCRWLIDTIFELRTPMHLGTGQSEAEKSQNADNEEAWVAGIVLDHQGRAAIPGASLKGALRALAKQHGQLDELQSVFGSIKGEITEAGLAEFRMAYASEVTQEESRPHVAIDRVTGTAMNKKLFKTRLIPAGTKFHSQIVMHRASQTQIEAMLASLQCAGQDPCFSVGAHASQGLGALSLFGQPQVKRFGPTEATAWLKQGGNESWEAHAQPLKRTPAANTGKPSLPSLPLQLTFSSPFLVKGGVEKNEKGHDVTVPMRQGEKVILPASSLRGRLRSQAERILRTLGIEVPQGHDAKPWRKGEAHTDLAALLFGSAGWRAIVGTTDCVDTAEKSILKTQELLAIDRFTGGGKDGAKFSIEGAECPTLAGHLKLDLQRLKNAGDTSWPALGLFTLLLRDLAEGDIAFGHGIAKGYGQCQEKQVLAAWESLLKAQFPEQADPVAHALAALRQLAPAAQPSQPLEVAPLSPADFKPTPASSGFLNPYHFIPLSKPDTEHWVKPEELEQSGRGHDRYHGLSGRIECSLTTKTPLFIGAKCEDGNADEPARLKGYEFQGKRAIPATSLRGMISSLFESISGSGFRVLHPQPYSMRKTDKHLSAMGRIIVHGEEGKMYLKPLTLPTLKQDGNSYPIPEKWKKIPIFNGKRVPLRVYFDADPGEYQASEGYYMRLDPVMSDDGWLSSSSLLRHPRGGSNTKFVIGQCSDGQKPISKVVWGSKSVGEQAKYTRGWVRTLETGDRRKGDLLPNTVQHLVFLPDLPENKRAFPLNNCDKRFAELADLAVEQMHIKDGDKVTDAALLPYVPCGRTRGDDRAQGTTPAYATRLQKGDLVFFDIDDSGKVSEISFSSMWRTGIKKAGSQALATTADLLNQYHPDLLPFGMGERQALFSPADLLFGAVEYRDKKNETQAADKKQALALAGRVLISLAQAKEATVRTEPAITLKELSSPKPPSPALYFKPIQGDGYVSKANLAQNSNEYTLRGRKTYLHAWRDKEGNVVKLNDQGLRSDDKQGREPWASKHHGQADTGHKRRVKVEPISADQTFTFHIDFLNLSEFELQQLCASLQPDPTFEHRLGMGKPLGLGSVKVEIKALELVDREKRYALDALDTERSHQALSIEEIASLAAAGMQTAPPDVRRALQLLGNPDAVKTPVHYPQVEGGKLENEHFKWFMTNDDDSNNNPKDNKKKALKTISANTSQLQTLPRLKEKDGNAQRGR